jgi:hypothetical protein
MRSPVVTAGCGLFMVLCAADPALAEPRNTADLAQQARVECAAGNYQAGARMLAELWVATKETVWIYNQARCYEQNNQNELAASRFREYLRVDTTLSPDEVKAIRQRIEGLQSAGSSPQQTPATAPRPILTGGAPPTGVVAESMPASPVSGPATATAPATPFYRRWWFFTGVGAVVVGGVVTAILLGTRSAPKSPGCDAGALCAGS